MVGENQQNENYQFRDYSQRTAYHSVSDSERKIIDTALEHKIEEAISGPDEDFLEDIFDSLLDIAPHIQK